MNSFQHKKSLGQNFLVNLRRAEEIIKIANIKESDVVLEVGPGEGALTNLIAKSKAKKIILIEKDERLIENLKFQFAGDARFLIINDDALKIDYKALAGGEKIKVIANLPYYIATELLFCWLDNIESFSALYLMFQKEVAERIVATNNNKEFGRLSILVQILCRVEIVLDLLPQDFNPPPKVSSSVIQVLPYPNISLSGEQKKNIAKFSEVIFSQRRKMLSTILKKHPIYLEKLSKLGIDLQLRPENLSIEDIKRIVLN
jgi:16S rRNA (adenine1518-N6/adenine1519-N6)-dimethyltransferase